jgi:hypothetical protein
MKAILILLPALLMLQGCLYFNDTGVSAHLYYNCKEYYDNCGIYHRECPPNLLDYKTIGEGLSPGVPDSEAHTTGACVEPATVTH